MASSDLSATKRSDFANSALKQNRKKGLVPGIFYIKGNPSIPIYVKDVAIKPFIYTSQVGVINLNIEGEAKPFNCIIRDIQFDPVSDKPIHFDLLGVTEKEKIKIEVPITLTGSPVGVKEGGIIQHSLHKIEIECFPKDIPSHIEVNIEHLNIGDAVHVNELKYENFEILESPEATIVAVIPPTVEEVVEAPPVEGEAVPGAEPTEPEVIAKGKKEEEGEEEAPAPEEKKKKKEKE
jgi:large subunit ribosomal protein L25